MHLANQAAKIDLASVPCTVVNMFCSQPITLLAFIVLFKANLTNQKKKEQLYWAYQLSPHHKKLKEDRSKGLLCT